MISNEHELVKVFNKHYINIVEKFGQNWKTLLKNTAKNYLRDNDKQPVELICNSYRNKPSMLKIESNITIKGNINDNTIFLPVSSNEIRKLSNDWTQRKLSTMIKLLLLLSKLLQSLWVHHF